MSTFVKLILIALTCTTLAAGSSQPNPADFPLNVRVFSFSKHLSDSNNTTTKCEDTSIPGPYEKTVQCQTVDLAGYQKDLQLQVGSMQYSARCQHCGNSRKESIGVGEYKGRWRIQDVELEILAFNETGKPRTAVYRIFAAAAAKPIAETNVSPCIAHAIVDISSTPVGAEITVDGRFFGSTPSSLELDDGDHAIVIKKKGFKDWGRSTRITGGKVAVTAELEKME